MSNDNVCINNYMRYKSQRNHLLFLLIGVLLFYPFVAQGKRVYLRTLDELVIAEQYENCTLVVKNEIDLKKCIVKLPSRSVLTFKGGSLKNGTVVGAKTKIQSSRECVFHDCKIEGEWSAKWAYSSMFDDDVDAMTLLKNMSCISKVLRLSANRSYIIHSQGEEVAVEVIEAESKIKPTIYFHTTDPNVSGIVLRGNRVTLRNLIIRDDYDEKNDALYGANKPTIGNTIAVGGLNNTVETLTIEGCDFSGGTSSSWVASSQVKNSLVKGCSFSGYMADHGVYCSMEAETFIVENCSINDVTHVSGLFKVRTSDKLRKFKLSNVKAHNYNGYLAMISLLETPDAEVILENIKVTKDVGNNSVFYGFCMNDETKSLLGRGYNARSITLSNCQFGYGYEGNPVIYPGAGVSVCSKEIKYNQVEACESNFGGGCSDKLGVFNSCYYACSGRVGIFLQTNELTIKKCKINSTSLTNCLFLVNYGHENIKRISLKDVSIDANTNTIINIIRGDEVVIRLKNCSIVRKYNHFYLSPKDSKVDIKMR